MIDQNEPPITTVNATGPNTARVYNAGLGEKDNFLADRNFVDEILAIAPDAKDTAAHNRQFLRRALRCVSGAGVHQVIDIGAGFPLSSGNTHDIMQGRDGTRQIPYSARPDIRVAYVDKDPVVVAHHRGMQEIEPFTIAIYGDLAKPRDILSHPRLVNCIDLTRPVAVLIAAVLHFLPSPAAYEAVEYVKRGLPPGSFLVVSHATADHADPGTAQQVQARYAAQLDPLTLRTRDEVAKFFDGWEVLEPGITDVNHWRTPEKPGTRTILYGAVARKSA